MNVYGWLGLVGSVLIVGPIILYYVARVIFLAYFTTKDLYERRKHGTR